MPDSIK